MSPTPAGVTITATNPDGTVVDVTEGVQVLYDLVIQSMDWSSGFLTVEDVEPILAIAEFCGFKDAEKPREYIEEEQLAERRRKCPHETVVRQPADEEGRVWDECQACGMRSFVGREATA